MDNKRKLVPLLQSFIKWPLYLFGLLIVMNIYLYIAGTKAGIIGSAFLLIYAAAAVIVYVVKRKKLIEELVRFGVNYGLVQRRLSSELEVPYAILDRSGSILWCNKQFQGLVGDKIRSREPLVDFFPDITKDVFPEGEESKDLFFNFGEKSFRALMKNITVEGLLEDSRWNTEKLRPSEESGNTLVAFYLYDETEINSLHKDLEDQELAVGLLYIDNYDEALESIDEVRRSLFAALVDRKINKYFQNFDAIIKKIEKDKYILICQNQFLEQLKQSKFEILDEVRGVNIGNEMSFTVSIGIGAKAGSYAKAYEAARAAIDLALGRGGDQVVIRETDSVSYYGGKSSSVEKNTKVKSRIKAHALRELIETKDKVLVMGHSMPDIDAFGSAVGIYKISALMNKEAHIVLSDAVASIKPMLAKFTDNPEYSGMIVTPEEALEMIDPMTLVVMVDVNRPSFTECPELVEKARAVVVLDHHRQSGDAVDNAVLSYIEPAASSACEVVSEIIQYIGDNFKLKPLEADAMFAGIMIDSNNFLVKTGIRTFESAAFLRRNGADVTRIRKMFRDEMTEYVTRAKAVASATLYLENFAFAECDAYGVDNPTVVGAQVANELMDVNNIKASFVFTKFNDLIYVSARSIDEINVQVVMEKLGGGGHMSAAGAQFSDCTVQEAMMKVKDVLREMQEGGDF